MRGAICVSAAVSMLLVIFAMPSTAGPSIVITTDKGSYVAGDTIEVSLAAENPDEAIRVDVYIGLIMPWGGIYTRSADAWRDSLTPWIEDLLIPSQFVMQRTPFLWFDVPEGIEAEFQFAAVLTPPGRFEFISEASFAPFRLGTGVVSDYYVDGESGDNSNDGSEGLPWRTITHALDSVEGSAESPLTIHILPGTYAPSTNGETFPLVTESWVSLAGAGTDSTILDAEDTADHVILCDGVTGVAIEGLAVKRGNADGEEGGGNIGGGILCLHGASVVIRNNAIRECRALAGGAIYSTDSSPTISGNSISSCSTSGSGGAICCYLRSATITSNAISENTAGFSGGAIYCSSCEVLIEGNTMSGNTSLGDEAAGGAVVCQECSATIRGNFIEDNSSACDGGGILLAGEGTLVIENNKIRGNSCQRRGGGLHLAVCDSSSVLGNEIRNNTAVQVGGGVYCSGHSLTLDSNTISNNTTGESGGGVMLWGVTGAVSLVNNLITGNSAQAHGGGVFYLETSGIISGNEIRKNTSGLDGGGICCHSASPEILNNTISLNTSNAGPGSGGGGIALNSSAADVHDNTISDNWSNNTGGGMQVCYNSTANIHANEFTRNHAEAMGGAIACYGSSPTIEDNSFTDNSAGMNGGAIYVSKDSSASIDGNGMQGNSAGEGGDDIFCEGD